jgi:outer membrane receptor for ferrienterochelin and colicins
MLLLAGLPWLPRAARADEPPAKGEATKPVKPAKRGAPVKSNGSPTPGTSGTGKAGEVEVVVTGTRTPESTQRATVRTDVVTRDEAERRGATNVGEALQGQLGVEVNPSAYDFLGGPSAIQIQGLDRERVLVLEDGERVIGDSGGAIDLSQIPLSDVSRIEVVAGPTSSLYGTSAIGGVVNVLTAPPLRQGPSARARIEGRSRLGLVLQGNGAYRKDDSWVVADGGFQRADGVPLREGSEELLVPEQSQSIVGLRAGTALNRRLDVYARARWIHDHSLDRQTQIVPVLGAFRIDLPEVTDRYTVHVGQTVQLGGGSNLRVTVGRQWAFNSSDKDRFESPVDENRDRTATLSSAETIATFVDGPTRTWVVGARGEVENLDQTLIKNELVLGEVQATEIVEVPPTTLGSGAIYAQLGWKLHETFTVMPGARGEMHLRYGGAVAPRLAAAWIPDPKWAVRVSGGRGFRAPSAKEFGFSFDHSVYGYRVIGNPDLEPETSWGVSGDLTWRPTKQATLRGGVFSNWIDNLIDVAIDPDGSGIAGVSDYTYVNVGKARTFGGQIDSIWQVSDRFRAEVGYSYLWTRDDTYEQPLQGRPPHTVRAAIRAVLPAELEVVLRYRLVTDAFIAADLRTPGFQTVDARLGRPLWPSSLLYVGVLNAGDTHRDPTRLADQRPLVGRTFYVGLTAELPWENEEEQQP